MWNCVTSHTHVKNSNKFHRRKIHLSWLSSHHNYTNRNAKMSMDESKKFPFVPKINENQIKIKLMMFFRCVSKTETSKLSVAFSANSFYVMKMSQGTISEQSLDKLTDNWVICCRFRDSNWYAEFYYRFGPFFKFRNFFSYHLS